jgi:putative redox protein
MSDASTTAALQEIAVEAGTVVVSETGDGAFTQQLLDGRHRLLADEPVSAGGKDLGPGPYELLLMALGACTSMTVRLYANRKQWPLQRVTVRLKHTRSYPKDCKECESKPVMLDHVDREIEFAGDLSDEQRTKLLEIAEKCPVHRTLSQRVEIATRMHSIP